MITDFFIELYWRIRTKSPTFFIILQVFGGVLIVLGYVPAALERWTSLIVDVHFVNFCRDVSKYATGFFGAVLLANKTKPAAQTVTGEAVKVTDDKKMPFTSKQEAKDVAKSVPPLPVTPDVPNP